MVSWAHVGERVAAYASPISLSLYSSQPLYIYASTGITPWLPSHLICGALPELCVCGRVYDIGQPEAAGRAALQGQGGAPGVPKLEIYTTYDNER